MKVITCGDRQFLQEESAVCCLTGPVAWDSDKEMISCWCQESMPYLEEGNGGRDAKEWVVVEVESSQVLQSPEGWRQVLDRPCDLQLGPWCGLSSRHLISKGTVEAKVQTFLWLYLLLAEDVVAAASVEAFKPPPNQHYVPHPHGLWSLWRDFSADLRGLVKT